MIKEIKCTITSLTINKAIEILKTTILYLYTNIIKGKVVQTSTNANSATLLCANISYSMVTVDMDAMIQDLANILILISADRHGIIKNVTTNPASIII
jgi:hypothetical protein